MLELWLSMMKRLSYIFPVFFFAAMLQSCSSNPQQKAFYNEVMMNGEILSTNINSYGKVVSVIKYQGSLYKCTDPVEFDPYCKLN